MIQTHEDMCCPCVVLEVPLSSATVDVVAAQATLIVPALSGARLELVAYHLGCGMLCGTPHHGMSGSEWWSCRQSVWREQHTEFCSDTCVTGVLRECPFQMGQVHVTCLLATFRGYGGEGLVSLHQTSKTVGILVACGFLWACGWPLVGCCSRHRLYLGAAAPKKR